MVKTQQGKYLLLPLPGRKIAQPHHLSIIKRAQPAGIHKEGSWRNFLWQCRKKEQIRKPARFFRLSKLMPRPIPHLLPPLFSLRRTIGNKGRGGREHLLVPA